MRPEDEKKWKELAEAQGYKGRCTWCWRFYKKELPCGMFQQCNDCGDGDVVVVATGEPMSGPKEHDRIPWPAKGTWLYDAFIEDRERDRPPSLSAEEKNELIETGFGWLFEELS